jgi:hypothetical protein
MPTDRDIDRISIPYFLNEIKNKSLLEIIDFCGQNKEWWNKVRSGRINIYKDFTRQANVTYEFIQELAFALNTGNRPYTLYPENWKMAKPIIEKLVEKKQLRPEIIPILFD